MLSPMWVGVKIYRAGSPVSEFFVRVPAEVLGKIRGPVSHFALLKWLVGLMSGGDPRTTGTLVACPLPEFLDGSDMVQFSLSIPEDEEDDLVWWHSLRTTLELSRANISPLSILARRDIHHRDVHVAPVPPGRENTRLVKGGVSSGTFSTATVDVVRAWAAAAAPTGAVSVVATERLPASLKRRLGSASDQSAKRRAVSTG